MQSSYKTEVKGAACIVCCCFGFAIAVDIAALVLGFMGEELCNGQGFMSLATFCIMVGFIGIAMASLSLLVSLLIFKDDQPKNKIWAFISGIILLIFVIIGFVDYGQVDGDCQNSPLGKMTLSWCIIRAVGVCCACFSVIAPQQQQ